jgi:hypothetical protein
VLVKKRSRSICGSCGWVIFSLFAMSVAGFAQTIIAPPPAASVLPAAVQENQAESTMDVFVPSETGAGEGKPTQPFQYGSLLARPHVLYRFLYGMGISSSPGQQHDTIVQQLSPGVMFDVGKHWTLDYTPTMTFYSSGGLQNTLDHSVQLGWGTAYDNWFLNVSQGVSITSDPQTQTAAQTDQQSYSTAASASYQFNDNLSANLGVSQGYNFVSGSTSTNYLLNLASSRSWSTMDWLNYALWPWLNVGIGAGFGYNQQDDSPDTMFEQYQAQIKWRVTDKISFELSGGLQDQQTLDGGTGDLLTPIMSAGIQYQPFEHTQLSLGASRTLSPAAFQGQSSENTSFSADLSQRLLGKLFMNVGGSYGFTDYSATSAALSTSRSDDYYSFSTSLSCKFPKRGTIAVFYQYSENSSSQSGFLAPGSSFSYSSSQIGVEVGYRY